MIVKSLSVVCSKNLTTMSNYDVFATSNQS